MAQVARQPLDLEVTQSGFSFNKWVNTLETSLVVQANKTAIRMATRLRDQVVQNILDEKVPGEPLSKKYLNYKVNQGLDSRMLIASGQYVDAIEVWKWMVGDLLTVQVGVRPNRVHKKQATGGHQQDVAGGKTTRMRMVDLARMLEYGTTKMPPRPVWGMTMNQLMDELKTFREWMIRQVNKQIRREDRKHKMRLRKIA